MNQEKTQDKEDYTFMLMFQKKEIIYQQKQVMAGQEKQRVRYHLIKRNEIEILEEQMDYDYKQYSFMLADEAEWLTEDQMRKVKRKVGVCHKIKKEQRINKRSKKKEGEKNGLNSLIIKKKYNC